MQAKNDYIDNYQLNLFKKTDGLICDKNIYIYIFFKLSTICYPKRK